MSVIILVFSEFVNINPQVEQKKVTRFSRMTRPSHIEKKLVDDIEMKTDYLLCDKI